jgi:hypothetical protein
MLYTYGFHKNMLFAFKRHNQPLGFLLRGVNAYARIVYKEDQSRPKVFHDMYSLKNKFDKLNRI